MIFQVSQTIMQSYNTYFTLLLLPEYQVRSIASHVRPDRQSMYEAVSLRHICAQNKHLFIL